MAGFEEAWLAVARVGEHELESSRLRPLLKAVYVQLVAGVPNLIELKAALGDLLRFLSGEGRTQVNCWATDQFFGIGQAWERDWTEATLPDEFHDLIAMMGQALHDTVQAPEVAESFGCLPEQLLERVKQLRVDAQPI